MLKRAKENKLKILSGYEDASLPWEANQGTFTFHKYKKDRNVFFSSHTSPDLAIAARQNSEKKKCYLDQSLPDCVRMKCKKCKCNSRDDKYIKSLNELSSSISRYLKNTDMSDANKRKIGEWKLMAIILDRFFFWVFTLMTIVTSFILLLFIPLLKNQGFFQVENST